MNHHSMYIGPPYNSVYDVLYSTSRIIIVFGACSHHNIVKHTVRMWFCGVLKPSENIILAGQKRKQTNRFVIIVDVIYKRQAKCIIIWNVVYTHVTFHRHSRLARWIKHSSARRSARIHNVCVNKDCDNVRRASLHRCV